MNAKKQKISYEEFIGIVRKRVRTFFHYSDSRPKFDEKICRYDISVQDFLNYNIYSVWYVRSDNEREAETYNPTANKSIRFDEALKRKDYLEVYKKGRDLDRPIEKPELVVLHCSGCDRKLVIDGNHRLTWLALDQDYQALLDVRELSGKTWPPKTKDIEMFCSCNSI